MWWRSPWLGFICHVDTTGTKPQSVIKTSFDTILADVRTNSQRLWKFFRLSWPHGVFQCGGYLCQLQEFTDIVFPAIDQKTKDYIAARFEDSKKNPTRSFPEGAYVMATNKTKNNKFEANFEGPFTLVPNSRYRILHTLKCRHHTIIMFLSQ